MATKSWNANTIILNSGLNLTTLSSRRAYFKVLYVYKFLNGYLYCAPGLFILHSNITTILGNYYSLLQTSAFFNSFLISSTKLWNALPTEAVLNSSISSLKNLYTMFLITVFLRLVHIYCLVLGYVLGFLILASAISIVLGFISLCSIKKKKGIWLELLEWWWSIIINEFRDYRSWWLFSCHGSVAEHWRLKPEVNIHSPIPLSFCTTVCILVSKDAGVRLYIFNFTFISSLPCLVTFWYAIPVHLFYTSNVFIFSCTLIPAS